MITSSRHTITGRRHTATSRAFESRVTLPTELGRDTYIGEDAELRCYDPIARKTR